MADTLKRVAGPVSLTDTAATVYTVPSLTVTTVTAIHVANQGSVEAAFALSIGTDGAGKRFFSGVKVPVGCAFDWAGTLVLAEAEVLQGLASVASTLTVTISGVETT
jgi:hypothetical protein